MAEEPTSYQNPRGDDAWDNDVIHRPLAQPGGHEFRRGPLMQCLRGQTAQVDSTPGRCTDAVAFARRNGVRRVIEPRRATSVFRLIRTDQDAPAYPPGRVDLPEA